MQSASKGFRACLRLRNDQEVARVQIWAAHHCALSTMFRSDRFTTILIGLKDEARSSASFARTIHSVLNKLAIPTGAQTLRGRWLSLITVGECVALCTGMSDAPSKTEPMGESGAAQSSTCNVSSADGDTKIVVLHGD